MAESIYQSEDIESFDLSPWVECPSSSRVSRYRYDFANRALQVQWRNNKNQGYVYPMEYDGYRSFSRIASKGRYINSPLNGVAYRPMDESEYSAPSNPNRNSLTSRVKS